MPLSQAYLSFVQAALESSWGTVGTNFRNLRARATTLRNNPTRAFPEGERVGSRDMDSTPSVPGRRWAQGDIPMFWYPDDGGLMMLASLGAETVAANPVGATTRKKHTIRCADMPPSLSLNNFIGSKVAGVDKAYQNLGMSIDRWTMTWDTTQDGGLLDFTYSVLGLYGQRINKPANTPSQLAPLPSWSAALNRNSVANCRVQGLTMTFENNVARVKAACGSRDDQDRQMGGRRLSGTMTLIYDDETEYDLFEGAGTEDIEIVFTDTNVIETITGTPYYGGLTFHIPKFCFLEYGREEVDGYWVQRIGFRGYRDATLGGPFEALVYNGEPAYT